MNILNLIAALILSISAFTTAFSVELTTELIAEGFSDPLFLSSPPGDTERLFIVEQNSGRIKIIKNGSVLETPFLDVGSLIKNGGERGLLGLAFHPKYSENGYFYINYTDKKGDTVVARYKVSDDPDIADNGSATLVKKINQPYGNHNGGMLAFGPKDGYLYIGTGDGGSGNDPQNRAQNGRDPLGKMLRLDVDNGEPYSIPEDNPFVDNPKVLDSIWATGLRNPWRYSFDSETGDLYIADVGQNRIEEISWQPGDSKGGENYGWRCMEGKECTGLSGCKCNSPELTDPIHQYEHKNGNCSVTGGYVYRGNDIQGLGGTYFFGDFCTGNIWSFKWDGTEVTEFKDRTEQLAPQDGSKSINNVSSFGQDARGELYVVDRDGDIFKIVTAKQDSKKKDVSNTELTLFPIKPGKAHDHNTFMLKGATPGGEIVIFKGRTRGKRNADKFCQGLTIDLQKSKPIIKANSDKYGNFSTAKFFSKKKTGKTILFQAVDLESCKKSNVVENTF